MNLMRDFTILENRSSCAVSQLVRKILRKEIKPSGNGDSRSSHPPKLCIFVVVVVVAVLYAYKSRQIPGFTWVQAQAE